MQANQVVGVGQAQAQPRHQPENIACAVFGLAIACFVAGIAMAAAGAGRIKLAGKGLIIGSQGLTIAGIFVVLGRTNGSVAGLLALPFALAVLGVSLWWFGHNPRVIRAGQVTIYTLVMIPLGVATVALQVCR
jgi:hypothetical protein